jgi:hypothetical protein
LEPSSDSRNFKDGKRDSPTYARSPQCTISSHPIDRMVLNVAGRLGTKSRMRGIAVSNRNAHVPDAVLRFAPVQERAANDGDTLDRAGDAILGFLHEAATVAKDNCQHAIDMAHKLSLRAAEDQVKDLEADVRYYKDRALRAEQWLQRIAEEIKKEFVPRNGERELPAGRNGAGEPALIRRP